jgi:hypothetical protein
VLDQIRDERSFGRLLLLLLLLHASAAGGAGADLTKIIEGLSCGGGDASEGLWIARRDSGAAAAAAAGSAGGASGTGSGTGSAAITDTEIGQSLK